MNAKFSALLLATTLTTVGAMAQDYRPNQEIVKLEKSIRNRIPVDTPAAQMITSLAAFHPVYVNVPEAHALVAGFSSKATLGVSSSVFLTFHLSDNGLVKAITAEYANTGP